MIYTFVISISYLTLCVGGDNVEKEAIKRARCSLGLIHDEDCPTNGGWSLWSAWGSCQGECGHVGHRTRQRACSAPPPANGGFMCHGHASETEQCDLKGCSEDEYQKLVRGDAIREAQFGVMKEVHREKPLLLEECLVQECTYDTVHRTLKDTSMQYWTALHCVKHNVGCPVKGGWSHWSSWSACTAACGLGSKYRQRNCTSPTPSEPQLACVGSQLQQEGCAGVRCSPYQRGDWSGWQPWTNCSAKCGSGLHTRARQCLIKPERQPSSSENESSKYKTTLHSECKGADKQIEQCYVDDCNVDGGWSAWEDWGSCSRTCGTGVQSRSRSCSNPLPQGNGQKCSGQFTEVQRCFSRPCTVKSHHIAALNGDGVLLYSTCGTPSRLLHMYLRFLTTSLFGTLVHRHQDSCMGTFCDYVTLSLEAGYLILSVQVSGCSATVISQNKVTLGDWHDVMLTVFGERATIRIDDEPQRTHGRFNCVPLLPQMDYVMRVGELFHGLIERITVNYNELKLKQEHHMSSPLSPYSSANIIYEVGDQEEGIRYLHERDIVEIPCPSQQWLIEVAVKVQKSSGLVLYVPGESDDYFVVITLQDSHVKLYCSNHSTSGNTVFVQQNTWLNVKLFVDDEFLMMIVNGAEPHTTNCASPTCNGQIYLGDVPKQIKSNLKSLSAELIVEPLEGALGSVTVGTTSLDLRTLSVEVEEGSMFSSRSVSVAELYDEVSTLKGQAVNMSCMYDGNADIAATWLNLDVPLDQTIIKHHVKDDGKFSELTILSYTNREEVEGFYVCWVNPRGGVPHVLVAYGVTVIEPEKEFNSEPVAAVGAIGVAAAVVCFVYVVVLALLYHRDKCDKQTTTIDHMIMMIQSQQGMKILGSEQEVQLSKLQVVKKAADDSYN